MAIITGNYFQLQLRIFLLLLLSSTNGALWFVIVSKVREISERKKEAISCNYDRTFLTRWIMTAVKAFVGKESIVSPILLDISLTLQFLL